MTMKAAVVYAVLMASTGACNTTKDRSSASDSVASVKAGSLEGPSRGDNVTSKRDTGRMAGMPGMTGMAGMMSAGAMDSMQTHMRMMDTTTAAQAKVLLPMHRQMVANMLSQMSSEMRSMNMASNVTWTATADSIRQDLLHMPDTSGVELKRMMAAHHTRVTRLMDMHREMEGKARK